MALRRLTPEHRAVLVLRFYIGLSVNEIADVLGIPPGTAASRLHYATRSFRAAFEADTRGAVEAEDLGVTHEEWLDEQLTEWLIAGPHDVPVEPIQAAVAHARTHPRRRPAGGLGGASWITCISPGWSLGRPAGGRSPWPERLWPWSCLSWPGA